MKKFFPEVSYQVRKFILKRQSLWSLGSQGLAAFAGLLVFGITSSRLTKEDFGIWILFVSISTLMDMFKTGLLFPGFLQQAAGVSKIKKRNIFYSVSVLFAGISVLQAILCLFLSFVVSDSPSLYFFFMFYPWIMLSGAIMLLGEWWLQMNNRFHGILILRLLNRFLLVVIVFFYLANKTDIIYITSLCNAITGILLISMGMLPKIKWRQLSREVISKLVWFARYATPSQLASNLLRSSDTFLISHYLGSAATGVYGVAARFLEFIELPVRSAGAVHYNQLARLIKTGETRKALHFLVNQTAKTTLTILPIAILLGVLAPYLIELLSGNQYSDSVAILQIMAIYCLLIPADRYIGLFLEAIGRPDLNMIKVMAMLILNVLADVLAIIIFKTPLAVAITSIITFILGVILGGWLVIHKASPDQPNYINFKLFLISKP